MVKAISFCLFGEKVGYVNGFVRNIEVVDMYYPDWDVVCYISEDTFVRFKDLLEPTFLRITLIIVSKDVEENIGGAFWRFLALEDYDTCIFRDVDSLVSHKELVAVNEWLESDKDFHIMRDHIYHGSKMMAGMWGYRSNPIKGNALRGIRNMILSYPYKRYDYGHDQMFLADVIYPMTKGNAVVHDERFDFDEEARGFPSFVYDHDNPHIGHIFVYR